jgi:hypothetical protein
VAVVVLPQEAQVLLQLVVQVEQDLLGVAAAAVIVLTLPTEPILKVVLAGQE